MNTWICPDGCRFDRADDEVPSICQACGKAFPDRSFTLVVKSRGLAEGSGPLVARFEDPYRNQALYLPTSAVIWAFEKEERLMMLASHFLDDLRRQQALNASFDANQVPQDIQLGLPLGKGGTNVVSRIANQPNLLIKNAGASSGRSREFDSMRQMEGLGMPTVARELRTLPNANPIGPRNPDGTTMMIVMTFVEGGIQSKDVIGYQRSLIDYINPALDLPGPHPDHYRFINVHTIHGLLQAWGQMTTHSTFFNDFQFMIESDGDVVFNDPTDTTKKESGTTRVIIQAMIDTYEFIYNENCRGKTWGEHKRSKKELHESRFQHFITFVKRTRLKGWKAPDFAVRDFQFAVFGVIHPCTLFRSPKVTGGEFVREAADAGLTIVDLGGNEVGYLWTAMLPARPTPQERADWTKVYRWPEDRRSTK